MKLIWGKKGFKPGLPARDLNEEEVKQYGEKRLLETGLYLKPVESRRPAHKQPEKDNEDNQWA